MGFMTQTPFEKFIALVEVDQKINFLNNQIATHRKKIADLVQESQSHLLAHEKIKEKYELTRKEVDAKELEMKILDQQESKKKVKLDHVANHREYQSIKAEIDLLKKSQHDLEGSLIGAWNQLENTKKELDASDVIYQQHQVEIKQQIDERENQIKEVLSQVDQLLADRIQKDQNMPAEWLEKYSIMRARVSDPVVPVLDGSCSACFYKVSAQDMQDLRRRKLVQCKDCYRLLYLQEAQQLTPE
jgi:predicted  nucleic acid-binding Zn-ribbon protein